MARQLWKYHIQLKCLHIFPSYSLQKLTLFQTSWLEVFMKLRLAITTYKNLQQADKRKKGSSRATWKARQHACGGNLARSEGMQKNPRSMNTRRAVNTGVDQSTNWTQVWISQQTEHRCGSVNNWNTGVDRIRSDRIDFFPIRSTLFFFF